MKPFHVTDKTKLKVTCPEKFRYYANRVEDNIPIFASKMLVSSMKQKQAQATSKPTGTGEVNH